jgi:hypothetical protein
MTPQQLNDASYRVILQGIHNLPRWFGQKYDFELNKLAILRAFNKKSVLIVQ